MLTAICRCLFDYFYGTMGSTYHRRPTCRPSMASRSMLGVSLEACLKVKLLQSMIRMKPLTCSSGSSIIDSKDSRIALSMSTNVYLKKRSRADLQEGLPTEIGF